MLVVNGLDKIEILFLYNKITMLSATSISAYHNKDLRIEITPKKITWFDKHNPVPDIPHIELGQFIEQINKSSSDESKYEIIPDIQNVPEMIKHIYRILQFTTLSEVNVTNGTLEEIIALLYMVPLEYDIQIVRVGVCRCYKGCNTVKDVKLVEEKMVTYGDVLKFITEEADNYPTDDLFCQQYSNPKLLIDILKKNNFQVVEEQIIKHMYCYTTDENLDPHYYDYQSTGILLEIEAMEKLPLVYKNCTPEEKSHGVKPNIKSKPNTTYVKTVYFIN